jgi:hypothetical protein
LGKQRDSALARIEKLRGALKWYADRNNYHEGGECSPPTVHDDDVELTPGYYYRTVGGKRAHAALAADDAAAKEE